jgi:tetratricopeptide (TPR) repeat protein
MALLSLLALAREGERTRSWLQDRLWGSRPDEQGKASLRRELANLRAALDVTGGKNLLFSDTHRISIDLERLVVDLQALETGCGPSSEIEGELLEGLDIAEEGFEDWLRLQRQRIGQLRAAAKPPVQSTRCWPGEAMRSASFEHRPSISVLPLIQACEDDVVLAEAIGDMLLDRISRLRWVAVIAVPPRGLEPEASGRPDLGDRLGADYLVRGRLGTARRDGRRELQLELAEQRTGRLLWSQRFVLAGAADEDGFTAIVEQVVAALATRLEVEQQMRVLDRGLQKLKPNELVWRARWHMRRLTREDARIAAELLYQAAADNPNDPQIWIEQAFLCAWHTWTSRGGHEDKLRLRGMAMRIRDADPLDARPYFLCGVAETWLGQHELAKPLFKEAIGLNPSMAVAYAHLGSCHSLAGEPERAIPLIETALRLAPLDMQAFHQFGELALANYMLGRFDDAVSDADRALARRPAYAHAHVIKIAALVELGDDDEEVAARRALAAVKPDYDSVALEWLPFKHRIWVAKLRDALRPAGVRMAN